MGRSKFLLWFLPMLTLVTPVWAAWDSYELPKLLGTEHIGSFVHLMEWTYDDIRNECHFLSDSGYTGILISPPVEHVILNEGRDWMERYMPISLTSLETRSGNRDELTKMIRECTLLYDLRIFADINLNNMLKSTTKGEVRGYGPTKAKPSEYQYDGISKDQFHKSCPLTKEDMNNKEKVRQCEVDDLQDLDNDNEVLRKLHVALINDLINIGISGFRLAMARYMDPDHLYKIYQELEVIKKKKKNIIFIHDVNDLEASVVTTKDYNQFGTVTDYMYSTKLANYFLKKEGRDQEKLLSIGDMGLKTALRLREQEPMVFLYNHVTQRSTEWDIITRKDRKAYHMAMAFMMAWPYGIPTVLSSYKGVKGAPEYPTGRILSPRPGNVKPDEVKYTCVKDFNCEHHVTTTFRMAQFNAVVKEHPITSLSGSKKHHWFAFSRGDKGFIFINAGDADVTKTFTELPLVPGEYCDIATGELVNNECTGRTIVIDDQRSTTITITAADKRGYVAIHTKFLISQAIKQVQGFINKDQDAKYLVNTGVKVFSFIRGGMVRASKNTYLTLNDPNAKPKDVLEAAAGKAGAQAILTTADIIRKSTAMLASNAHATIKSRMGIPTENAEKPKLQELKQTQQQPSSSGEGEDDDK